MMGGTRPGDQQDGGKESRAEWGLTEEGEKECGGDGSGSRLKVFTPVAVGRKVLKVASVTEWAWKETGPHIQTGAPGDKVGACWRRCRGAS